MNPMDILGGMLGRKSGGKSGGGLGGAILGQILKGATRRRPQPSNDPPGRSTNGPKILPPKEDTSFNSLEDLLHNAHQRHQQRRQPAERFEPEQPDFRRRQTEFTAEYEGNPEPFNQKAELLVIAMINAAKADGRIDQSEQDSIVKQLGDLSQDEIQFLQTQFAAPLDVKEFVWSVPLGMEKQVYAVSLMAIDLDQNSEAQYLKQLGHGFRMSVEECNRIHAEFGAPQLRA